MASRKGKPNKASASREAYYAKEGILPLPYMLAVLRDETKTHAERMDAAKNAAPYVHPKLSQADVKHSGGIDVRAWLQSLGEPKT